MSRKWNDWPAWIEIDELLLVRHVEYFPESMRTWAKCFAFWICKEHILSFGPYKSYCFPYLHSSLSLVSNLLRVTRFYISQILWFDLHCRNWKVCSLSCCESIPSLTEFPFESRTGQSLQIKMDSLLSIPNNSLALTYSNTLLSWVFDGGSCRAVV